MIYWDTSYLAKLYINEPGTEQVLEELGRLPDVVCCEHGRLELMATLKRNQREGVIPTARLRFLWQKHQEDLQAGLFRYLPIRSALIEQACGRVAELPSKTLLRAADALHLTCAADAGCKEIYSHDRHLLAAATHFGLRGIDVISSP